jgi:hypothetical protein
MSWFWLSILILALVGGERAYNKRRTKREEPAAIDDLPTNSSGGERTSDASAFVTAKKTAKHNRE